MTEQASLFQLDQPGETISISKAAATTFDRTWAAARKKAGMTQAAEKRREVLALARDLVRAIAMSRTDRTANADDAQKAIIDRGHKPEELGNAAGSIFRGKEWVFTGRRVKSQRSSSNEREIKVWYLRG